MESDIIEKRAGHKTIDVNGELIQVPRDTTPAQEDRIRQDVHKRQLERKLEPPKAKSSQEVNQESKEMSDEELADTLGFFAGMGALAFAVGAFGGIVYGLLWVFGNYGVLGIIASLMVGGAFVSLSSLAIAEWRGVA